MYYETLFISPFQIQILTFSSLIIDYTSTFGTLVDKAKIVFYFLIISTHTHTHIHAYTHIHTHIYIYIYIYAHAHTRKYQTH